MADDPAFRQALVARYADLRLTHLSEASLAARIDGFTTLFGTTVDDNFDRWPEQDIVGGDDWVLSFLEGCPTYTWEESRDRAANWLRDRLLWLDDHLDEWPG